LRIAHVSDIHFWRYALNPLRLLSKRMLGTASLLLGRARRFRIERVPELVSAVLSLNADHLLITGDLTTTALPGEFRAARTALAEWLADPERVTILPGNHDRYTIGAHRTRRFEQFFGAFAPQATYPWIRRIDAQTAILGLDPTRAGITPRGKLPKSQLSAAAGLLETAGPIPRLLIACHYPVAVPDRFAREYLRKPLVNLEEVRRWLRSVGPHLFCCGHVHAAWAFQPEQLPNQLCVNPGAPLLADRRTRQLPGFCEILLEGSDVLVRHHAWTGDAWAVNEICRSAGFFPAGQAAPQT
jgi:3',5'-cyclic AMP phosphodiesterase CpdA